MSTYSISAPCCSSSALGQPCCCPSDPLGGLHKVEDLDAAIDKAFAGIEKPERCWKCMTELCEALDAYHGKDPRGKHYCVKCRPKF